MRAWRCVRWSSALVTGAGLAVLGLSVPPALAAPAGHAAAAAGRGQPVSHSNVGEPHSPELLRKLAGPARPLGARQAARALHREVIAGAVQGVDVASFQHPSGAAIDWASVAGAGIKFAAVKATEGDYYTNPYAVGDLTGAQSAGMSTVAYAFGIPNGNGSSSSPVVQADDLVTFLTGKVLPLPPIMLDIEYNPYGSECYGLSQPAMVTWINGFSAEVLAKTGRLPIIYSTQDWLATCTGNSTALGNGPLWIAQYASIPSPSPLPANWTDWGIWQYSSTGSVSGISGHVDLDQLNPDSFIAPGKLMVFNPGPRRSQPGAAASAQVEAYAEETSPALSYAPTTMPSWLNLNTGTGQLTGTAPSSSGSYPVTVTASDATSGASGPVSFTWYTEGTVTAVSPGSQSTTDGSPVGLQLKASDTISAPPITFTATGLPPGLSVASNGLITGWPSTPGSYNVTVTATDHAGNSGSASFTWTVSTASSSGPTGAVRLDLAGKCLNDVGNKSADGTKADIWTCNSSTAQKWTHVQDGTLRIHSKCLVVPGGATSGTPVVLASCTGGPSQQWRLVGPRSVNPGAGTTPVTLANLATGMCLADPGASTANGTTVTVSACDGATDQAWTLPAGPVTSQVPGLCLDDAGGKTSNGNKIDVYTCNGTSAQQWTAEPDGTVRVLGKCLAVHGGGTVSGTPADLYTCNGTGAQQWQATQSAAGAVLVNPQSGLCLTDPGSSGVKGTALQVITCTQIPGQEWRIQ
ncbi:MAG TPA: ricin-type beta-trefoil lectin domain protein [Streptosporangiaceae bacterium]